MALIDQFRRHFGAKKRERPVPTVRYEHDWITPDDLLLLGLGGAPASAAPSIDEAPSSSQSAITQTPGSRAQLDDDCRHAAESGVEGGCTSEGAHVEEHLPSGPPKSTSDDGRLDDRQVPLLDIPSPANDTSDEPATDLETPDFRLLDSEGLLFLDDEDRSESRSDQLESLWHVEVPEAEDAPASNLPGLDRCRVSAEERAAQLALAFLESEGEGTRKNLDLLTDIILDRGWSAVQVQVRALVRAGYDIPQIHLMFQLTSVWLHYVESDSLAPEQWHGGARLTWLEAARLLDFIGYEAEIEQVADFLSEEQEIWSQVRRSTGQLATFKNYLFRYRLSHRTQVDDGIWQLNLDPEDSRSFDGTRNSLYSVDWWDEPTDCGKNEINRICGRSRDPARIAECLWPDGGDSL